MCNFTDDLRGRTVLVTGASSGLGARFAQILGARGGNVVLAARRAALLDDVCARIKAQGGQAMAVTMDVTEEASVQAAYDSAAARFGRIDGVIANAGMNVEGAALDVDVAALDAVLAVNVRGVFLTVREAARRMIAAPAADGAPGRIVIVSSITASAVSPGLALYSASKAAVLQLGRVLARDWANKGVNLNILCPGYIETDLNAEWFGGSGGQKQIAKWPRRRLMGSGALDGALFYLLSSASDHVTGTVMTVDDGQTLS